MALVDRLSRAVQDFSYATKTWLVKELPYRVKKTVRTIALPVAMGMGGMNLSSCTEQETGSKRYTDGNSYVVLPAKTKVLNNYDELTEVNTEVDNQIRLYFTSDSSFARGLEQGDIIVSGISDKTPRGLLVRMIDNLHYIENTAVRAVTEPASLEEAIEEGHLQGQLTFTETMQQPLRVGGAAETRTFPLKAELGGSGTFGIDFEQTELMEGVYIDGNVSLLLQANFSVDISAFSVRRFSTGFGLQQTATLEGMIRYEGEIDKTLTFDPFHISAKQFSIGDFPVVITPVFSIEPFVHAEGRMDVQASVSEELAANFGIAYSREKGWEPSGDFFVDFNYREPTFSGCGDAKVGVRPQVALSVYGVITPYSGFEVYLRAKAERTLSVSAGIEMFIGGKVGILGKTLADTGNLTLYTQEKPLWESPTPCQEMTGEEPTCTPDSYRRCENSNISVYNSCNQLERTISCDTGCSTNTDQCTAPVGEGEIPLRTIRLPLGPGITCYTAAFDGELFWYIPLNIGSRDLCSVNIEGRNETCFENITPYNAGIAFSEGNLSILEHPSQYSPILTLSTVDRRSGSKQITEEIRIDRSRYSPNSSSLTIDNGEAYFLSYLEESGNVIGQAFCRFGTPLSCEDRRMENVNTQRYGYVTSLNEGTYLARRSNNVEATIIRLTGNFVNPQEEELFPIQNCAELYGSIIISGDTFFVQCQDRILEYSR